MRVCVHDRTAIKTQEMPKYCAVMQNSLHPETGAGSFSWAGVLSLCPLVFHPGLQFFRLIYHLLHFFLGGHAVRKVLLGIHFLQFLDEVGGHPVA